MNPIGLAIEGLNTGPETKFEKNSTDVVEKANEPAIIRKLSNFWNKLKTGAHELCVPLSDDHDYPFSEKKGAISTPCIAGGLGTLCHLLSGFLRPEMGVNVPHYDKLSDVGCVTYEPLMFTRIFKKAANFGLEKVNQLFLSKKDKEIFYYDSLTYKELVAAIVWYGTLWITSEINAIHDYHILKNSTADPYDIPAYLVGLTIQYKHGKEILKRFPSGRFMDVEKSVGLRLDKFEKEQVVAEYPTINKLERSFQKDETDDKNIASEFLKDYKQICATTKEDVLIRTKDIYNLIKKDSKLVQAYKVFVKNYTFALSRKWFLEKLEELGDGIVSGELLEANKKKFTQKKGAANVALGNYREILTTQNSKKQMN